MDAILWDMDGTLINSTAAADKTYELFVTKHNIASEGHPHVSGREGCIPCISVRWSAWLTCFVLRFRRAFGWSTACANGSRQLLM